MLTATAAEIMLSALAARIGWLSLHDPDGVEVSQRQVVAWTADGRRMETVVDAVFEVAGGVTVGRVGFWSGDGATFLGDRELPEQPFASMGTYTIPAGDLSETIDG